MSDYSFLDRMVHRLAFCTPKLQLTMADMEESFFKRDYAQAGVQQPIFITSLPRAGTTILLTALNELPELASHLYRDMPFVLAPLLWNRISASFRRDGQTRERAHKDGIRVGFDSPEAFEEIIWHAFWPEKYTQQIALWNERDDKPEARRFFHQHMRKIIALRCPSPVTGRYLCKNNGNMARLDVIPAMFTDARILVPFRLPLAHAASLLRQHVNFLDMHKQDPFVYRYMRDIGHFEFGMLHRPIAFEGFDSLKEPWQISNINYWLAYWVAAFEHVKNHRHNLVTVSYEQLCHQGCSAIGELCEKLHIEPGPRLRRIAAHFHPPHDAPVVKDIDAGLLERAMNLYESLTRH